MKKNLSIVFSLLTMVAFAKVDLPPIMGSGMVLQQKSAVNLWGKAKPDATVRVTTSWNKVKVKTKVDADGRWQVQVATPQAGGPYMITVGDGDGEAVTLDNVLIGEVWICSGQSNMEMPVIGTRGEPISGSVEAIINAINVPDIRMFTVPKAASAMPMESCGGEWQIPNAKSVSKFSATAYFFALNLNRALGGVPVGMINASWGGTSIQPWMPESCSEKIMDDDYLIQARRDDFEPRQKMGHLYNGMILPIIRFKARGFLWYQGERNLSNYGIGKTGIGMYAAMMQELVAQWRKDWGDTKEEMPFYYVQIAPFSYGRPDATERPLFVENQKVALKLIPNSGMAATTDIGNLNSVHPMYKDKVGQRLALLAIAKTYGQSELPVDAPSVKEIRFENGKAVVRFEPTPGHLNTPDHANVAGFELSGKDKIFYTATAKYDRIKNEVSVSCEIVPTPVAVRFGYRNYIDVNLFNALGIPPYSFRSDDFER